MGTQNEYILDQHRYTKIRNARFPEPKKNKTTGLTFLGVLFKMHSFTIISGGLAKSSCYETQITEFFQGKRRNGEWKTRIIYAATGDGHLEAIFRLAISNSGALDMRYYQDEIQE